MFYLNSTLNFGIPIVLVFQLEVYYKVVRLLTGLLAQHNGTTARWYSNKTSLHNKTSIYKNVLYNQNCKMCKLNVHIEHIEHIKHIEHIECIEHVEHLALQSGFTIRFYNQA